MYYNYRILILLLFVVLASAFSDLCAQQDQRATDKNSGAEFNQIFNSYYYQDPLGYKLGSDPFAADGVIDPATYILGPDDVISIEIEGTNDLLLRALPVNSLGDIVAPVIGTVSVAGHTIKEAAKILQQKSDSIFRSSTVSVTLERAKNISFYIAGDVNNPGKHTLPAFSRISDAVYKALTLSSNNEPLTPAKALANTTHSLRNITVQSANGNTETADLITFLSTGNLDMNPLIQLGDRIVLRQVTKRSPRISISGAVMNPRELEYSPLDNPELLIRIAGGLSPEADTSKLFIYRNGADQINKIVAPAGKWAELDLQPNDRLVVPKNPKRMTSASAWIEGEVQTPGNFPINNGESTAFELLQLSDGLTNNALASAAYLTRAGDVENEVPDKLNPEIISRTSDQISQEMEYLKLESRISENKVHIDLNNEDQLKGVKLFDGDRIFVPRDENTIFIFGQVNNPGYYPALATATNTFDYIEKAGGFAMAANKERIFVIKAGSNTWYRPEETSLESGDRIFVDRVPYDELNAQRNYEIQREQIKNSRIQLIMTGITTITGIITTYVAIQNIK